MFAGHCSTQKHLISELISSTARQDPRFPETRWVTPCFACTDLPWPALAPSSEAFPCHVLFLVWIKQFTCQSAFLSLLPAAVPSPAISAINCCSFSWYAKITLRMMTWLARMPACTMLLFLQHMHMHICSQVPKHCSASSMSCCLLLCILSVQVSCCLEVAMYQQSRVPTLVHSSIPSIRCAIYRRRHRCWALLPALSTTCKPGAPPYASRRTVLLTCARHRI